MVSVQIWEQTDMVERYRKRTGRYPSRVLADKIYRNRDNLAYCKLHHIRLSGPALGRPKKDELRDIKSRITSTNASVWRLNAGSVWQSGNAVSASLPQDWNRRFPTAQPCQSSCWIWGKFSAPFCGCYSISGCGWRTVRKLYLFSSHYLAAQQSAAAFFLFRLYNSTEKW